MSDAKRSPIILNPRPDTPANQQLLDKLAPLKLNIIHSPALALTKTDASLSLHDIKNCHIAIFISQAAVHFGLPNFQTKIQNDSLSIAAIGEATKKQLEGQGIKDVIIGDKPNSEALFRQIKPMAIDKNVVLIKGRNGRHYLEKHLSKIAANFTLFCPYERTPLPSLEMDLNNKLTHQHVDFVLATSIDVCKSLLAHAPTKDILAKLKLATWITLSSRIKHYLESVGINKILVTEENLFSTIEKITT